MKKIIPIVIILSLIVLGSAIGVREYKEIQIQREQETLTFLRETYNELCELGTEFNNVEYDYYGLKQEQVAYDEIASDIEDIVKELKEYEIKSFKNNEEYIEILALFTEATEDFEKSVTFSADYRSSFDSEDMVSQSKYMRKWNKKADDVIEFIEEKELLHESEEI